MKIAGLDLSISSSGVVIEELDDNLDIVSVERHGFTDKKKMMDLPGIVYYNRKDFVNDYQRYQFFCDHIVEWCKDCDYVAVEDYAYGMSCNSGMVFSLAEFEGNIKMSLFRHGKKLRFYPPSTNKKFFTGVGNCGKLRPYHTFIDWACKKFDITDLPEVIDDKKGAAPTSDLIDAYALCEFLRKELRIRSAQELLHEQPIYVIECFYITTKEHPTGLLVAPFMEK